MYTYISLFSSAGIGCYGFKEAGFECIATNEIIERRLAIQRSNCKCKYPSGYICGDITLDSTKQQLEEEVQLWKRNEKLSRVDVIVATPPCQGMSVANHKKTDKEIVRNSLVVESISIIKKYHPRFFVFENVPAFMKTLCTDLDGTDKAISEAIDNNLGKDYSYASRVINFKNYGASSSRQRTLVIGVANDIADDVSPYELFPELVDERTLREVIGDLPELAEMGEIDASDIYHSFRPYPEQMRMWIHDLKEGMSAFDNTDDIKKPHQIIDGKIVINQRKNGDKYTRNYWDKVGPCVHTRNDQLASQNTIHPRDDRVFSIRELMRMMTIPDSFKWTDDDLDALNSLSDGEKRAFLKKNEINIRQSIGEAVPTAIFFSIAMAIRDCLEHPSLKKSEIPKIIEKYQCAIPENLLGFIDNNPLNLSLASLSKIAEMANVNRTESAAFYTSKSLITEIVKMLPDIDQDEIHILEPSCGVGNFVSLLFKKYEGKKLIIDLVDIDPTSIQIAKRLISKSSTPNNC